MFDGRFRAGIERGVQPVAAVLNDRGVKPDHLTILGLATAVVAAVVVANGWLLAGFFLLVLTGVPDLLDGAVAKAGSTASRRGAYFDSVADRVSDALLLGGVAWYLADTRPGRLSVLPLAVLGVSFLVSYQRAKADALGFDARGGLMERAERFTLLSVGLVFSQLLVPVLWLMLGATSVTAAQRFVKVWRQASAPRIRPVRRPRRPFEQTARTTVREWRRRARFSGARSRR